MGLSSEEAESRLQKYGTNELEKEEAEGIWEKIKEQFEDILVRMLLLAAVISFVISQFEEEDQHAVPAWVEPCVIFTILIINAGIGIWQDLDAEKAIEVRVRCLSPVGAERPAVAERDRDEERRVDADRGEVPGAGRHRGGEAGRQDPGGHQDAGAEDDHLQDGPGRSLDADPARRSSREKRTRSTR